MVRQAAEVTLCISERLRLSSGHHAYGSAARPLRPQIKDGVFLEYIHFKPLPPLSVPYQELDSLKNVLLKVIPESTRKEVTQIQRTRVLVIESKNSQVKICVFQVENCKTGRWTI